MTITEKQQRFVDEYLVDLNGTQAAIRAGYSAKTATPTAARLLTYVNIQAGLTEGIQRRKARTEINQDWVVDHLALNVDRAMQAEPVLDREGVPTGEYTYQGNVANRALELLGRHTGGFAERKELTGADGGPVAIDWAGAIQELEADKAAKEGNY